MFNTKVLLPLVTAIFLFCAASASADNGTLTYASSATASSNWYSAASAPGGNFASNWEFYSVGGSVNSYSVDLDNVQLPAGDVTLTPNGTNAWDVNFTVPLAGLTDGGHQISITLVSGDNTPYQDTEPLNVENTPPGPVINISAFQDSPATWEVDWSDPPNDTAPLSEVAYSTTQPTSATPPADTQYQDISDGSTSLTGLPYPNGTTLWVWVTDVAGNNDALNAQSILLGTQPAGQTGGGPGADGNTGSATPITASVHGHTIKGKAGKKAKVKVTATYKGKVVAKTTTKAGGAYTITIPSRDKGKVVITVGSSKKTVKVK